MVPVSRYLHCAGYELHLMDWGDQDAPVVLAWHGLARTGRDMDELAEHLAACGFRVICPDTLGRGLSQWSRAPDEEYCLAFYTRLASALLDRLGVAQVRWIGTSMGGAIGMAAAGGALAGRITHLVLNDIAPELAAAAVQRIKAYAGQPPAFATVTELEAFFRQVYAPYGWLSDAQWRRLTETSTRRLPDGRVTPHYDPAMVRQFTVHPHDYDQWAVYEALDLPVLCLHGVDSDLVLPETIARMKQCGPGARGQLEVIEVPGCGHAPALNVPEQLAWVERFFAR
ncbi:alpha/beta fold hydrolase [Comamonas sp. NLF-1-9]|uniref:alpha/beta fold hydrolase n=1 Tax=Comamonas sp. NLF-1-9 TaxID=2853163 RepID=UPI001C45E294|nr:alpha/beta hydrolase [Comamonas sp. NLF-1-9]QXL85394.1 alpha/beta hydrolase [Comamonas sp. NLF-1-9]